MLSLHRHQTGLYPGLDSQVTHDFHSPWQAYPRDSPPGYLDFQEIPSQKCGLLCPRTVILSREEKWPALAETLRTSLPVCEAAEPRRAPVVTVLTGGSKGTKEGSLPCCEASLEGGTRVILSVSTWFRKS
jgi:hypothetical protein